MAHIAAWHECHGLSADEIAREWTLELVDIYAALAYYFAHRQEVARPIREGEEAVQRLREDAPSLLNEKLGTDVSPG